MKTLLLTSLAAGLLVAASAHAETLSEKTGVNSALGLAPSTADFVNEAANTDMFEIQASKLAEQRATDQPTMAFAAKMIDDHGHENTALAPLAKAANVPVPTTLDSAHAKMLDQLNAAKGGDFVKLYHEDQVAGHKQAVSLYERYAKNGKNPQLKSFASKTLPTIEDHLKMAENLDR
jgi:putative membrane protein